MAGAIDFAFGLYPGDCGCGRCWREEALKTWFRIRVGIVESCVQKSRKLLTQLPLHSTPFDFWELVKIALENIPPSTTGDLCSSSSQVCALNLRCLGGGKCANPTTSANAAGQASPCLLTTRYSSLQPAYSLTAGLHLLAAGNSSHCYTRDRATNVGLQRARLLATTHGTRRRSMGDEERDCSCGYARSRQQRSPHHMVC
jgi:hypothetical protein